MRLAFLLFFVLISLAAITEDELNSYRIRSIEPLNEDNELMVTFWEDNRVYRIRKNSKVHDCLEGARKRLQKVRLELDKEAGSIEGCRPVRQDI